MVDTFALLRQNLAQNSTYWVQVLGTPDFWFIWGIRLVKSLFKAFGKGEAKHGGWLNKPSVCHLQADQPDLILPAGCSLRLHFHRRVSPPVVAMSKPKTSAWSRTWPWDGQTQNTSAALHCMHGGTEADGNGDVKTHAARKWPQISVKTQNICGISSGMWVSLRQDPVLHSFSVASARSCECSTTFLEITDQRCDPDPGLYL